MVVFLFQYMVVFLFQYTVVFLFNTVIYGFLLLGLCILIVQLPWLRFFRAFSSVVRQMPGYNSPRRGTASTVPFLCCSVYCFLCCSMYCLFFLSLCVLFVCKCVLYYCHRVSTQLQLTNNININNIYTCPERDSNPRSDHSEVVSATVNSLVMLVTCLYRNNSTVYLKQYNKLADTYRVAQKPLNLVGNGETSSDQGLAPLVIWVLECQFSVIDGNCFRRWRDDPNTFQTFSNVLLSVLNI
jgi:hypothetical protein